MGNQVFRPLLGSRLWAFCRIRLSPHGTTALVCDDPASHDFRVCLPTSPRVSVTVPPWRYSLRLRDVLSNRFGRAFQVSLLEHQEMVIVGLSGDDDVLQRSFHVRVRWWVHDPALVVHNGVDDAPAAVHHSIRARVADRVRTGVPDNKGESERVLHETLEAPFQIPDMGVSYQGVWVGLASTSAADQRYWNATRRADFDFYRRIVQEGRTALLALWLMEDGGPDSARFALDWVKDTPDPHDPDQLAQLFRDLEPAERMQVRRAAASTIAGLNGSTAQGLRDQMNGAQGSPGHETGPRYYGNSG